MTKKLYLKFSPNFFENLSWEKSLYTCGIDEVGRGCLAGPLVTAAAILPINAKHKLLKDSKTLNEQERNIAYDWITKNCFYSIAISSHQKIDSLNIYKATLQTMKKSFFQLLQSLPFAYEQIKYLLVDAMPLSLPTSMTHKNLEIHYFNYGETISTSIAAASIVAKVTRDKLMQKICPIFPKFNMQEHKGYGTEKHIKNLNDFGPSLIHRTTFISKVLKVKTNETKQCTLF